MGRRFGLLVILAALAVTGVWISQRQRVAVQRDFSVAQAMLKADRPDVAFPLISAHRGDPAWRGLELLLLERLGYEIKGVKSTDHLWLLFDVDRLVAAGKREEARELLRSHEYGDRRDVPRLARLVMLSEDRL